MDEIWERAVETALDGQADCSSARSLTLDGAVKCVHGRLPPPGLLEKFQNLEHLSIANVGVSSLEKFPRLRKLQKLILSDNRIAGGLEFLVEAGLESLRDLDLSNNRIQYLDDLAPLAQLRLVSLDLYECPVTRVKDYRSRVFNMIKSLKYLDKMDADENETPESEEEEDEDEDDDDEDPGSGEVDGEDQSVKMVNGGSTIGGVVDEDELSDADEEETETSRSIGNGLAGVSSHLSNGFHVLASTDGDDDEYDVDDEDDDDLGEEIDEEDDDVVEVHEIEESDEEEDGVEEEDDDDDDDDGEDADEDVEDEDEGAGLSRVEQTTNTEGEIDGHDHGEEGDDDENGEIGEEEEQELEEGGYYEEDEGDEEEEDFGSEYLVQPVMQAEDIEGSDVDLCNEDDGEEDDVEEDVQNILGLSSSSIQKRKRDVGDDDDEDDYLRSIKRH